MGNGTSKCEWRHAPEACGGFREFWSKLVELRTGHRTRRVDFRSLAEDLGRCHTRSGWGRWKSQNRKNVYLFPYVEEPLNSKVKKNFVPELRIRYVFFEFRVSYVISLWTFNVRFTHSHIMAMVLETFLVPELGMSFMAWLRLGYQRDDQRNG